MLARYASATAWHCVGIVGIMLCPATAWSWWDFGGPAYQRGFAAAPAPSIWGYNLDDPNPGYFGGGRYREYYSYGRGYGIANFPGPLPNYPYGYVPKSLRAYPSPWTPPRDFGPVVVMESEPVAYLEIQVPAEAEVWIDDTKTQQAGQARTFVTPPLASDKVFTYEIKAKWNEDGKAVEQSQIVMVQAGKRVQVSFPATPAAQSVTPGTFPLEP